MSELHIAVIAMSFAGYGGERAAANLALGLSRMHRVTIVQLGNDQLPSELHEACAVVSIPRRSGLSAALRTAGSLAGVYDDVRPDAVISVMTYCNLVALAARRRSVTRPPVVASEHSITSQLMGVAQHPWPMRLACMALYPTAEAIVGVSEATVRDLRRFLRPAPLHTCVIYNSCAPANSLAIRRSPSRSTGMGESRGGRRIVCVASLKEAKNHELLIRAFASLPDDVALDVVGDGPLRERLESLAGSLGLASRVVFHGYLQDPSNLLAGAAVSVLSSRRWEGFRARGYRGRRIASAHGCDPGWGSSGGGTPVRSRVGRAVKLGSGACRGAGGRAC